MTMQMNRIVIVGVGGIGEKVLRYLAMFLQYSTGHEWELVLVDGDAYEDGNRDRQAFGALGNKATVKVAEFAPLYDRISFRSVPEFVTADNVSTIIRDGDVVFLCVDDHTPRRIVSEHCGTLRNVTLISGGNELTDGNVQIFMRADGVNLIDPITKLHPEIGRAKRAQVFRPAEGCGRMAAAEPQLVFANLAAATTMLNAFYAVYKTGEPPFDEAYFDVMTGAVNPVTRRAPADAGRR